MSRKKKSKSILEWGVNVTKTHLCSITKVYSLVSFQHHFDERSFQSKQRYICIILQNRKWIVKRGMYLFLTSSQIKCKKSFIWLSFYYFFTLHHQTVKSEFISCPTKSRKISVGCISQNLIPSDLTYWVEFKDEETNDRASVCFETCTNIYVNTRYVLMCDYTYVS